MSVPSTLLRASFRLLPCVFCILSSVFCLVHSSLTTDSTDEHGLGECVYAVLFTHFLAYPSAQRASFNFLLLACNSQGFGLSVRYILYPMDGFFSSELRTKSPRPYGVNRISYLLKHMSPAHPRRFLRRIPFVVREIWTKMG